MVHSSRIRQPGLGCCEQRPEGCFWHLISFRMPQSLVSPSREGRLYSDGVS